ncbi:MAG: hypothetical protein QQN63_06745 [Nitrosopumilus sp.]
MTDVPTTRSVIMIKEEGEKWKVEFNGRISRRDLNVLRRILPVEYARKSRRSQLKRMQDQREAHLVMSEETVSTDTNSVKTSVLKTILNVVKKESSDAV